MDAPAPTPVIPFSQYDTADKPIDYKYYLFLFKKNLNFIVTFLVMGASLLSIHVSRLPNQYTASAQILIERPIGSARAPQPTMTPEIWAEDYYTTQKEIMLSPTVLRQAVAEMKLVEYFGAPDIDTAAAIARGHLQVVRVRDSRLFNIVATSNDPQFSMTLANAVSRAYIRKNFEDMLYFSKELLSWVPREGQETISVEDPFGKVKQMTRDELIETLPSIQTDPTLRALEERKSALKADLTTLLKQFREKHPLVVKANASLKFLEDSIVSERQRIIEMLRQEAAGKLQVSNARIIEEAVLPKGPSGPNRNRTVLTGLGTELFVILCLILIWDYFDDTVHSPDDLQRKGITIPFLGPIPLVKPFEGSVAERFLITHYQRKSHAAESFRFLRVAINFSAPAETLKTLVFTSSVPGEGKSFVTHNIGISLAQDGNRTLLIDADLRRPRAHRIYKIENQTGLSNYLTSDIEFNSIIRQTFVENLSVILSGPASPNPAEILGSNKMIEFLQAAKERFDRIVIDAPPLAGIGDALVLGKITTHVVFVIRSSHTPTEVIRQSRELLEKSGVRIIGAVLNFVDVEKERYGGYYKYYYQSYGHYGTPSS